MKRSSRANLLLLLTAMIWGAAFVAQDVAADSLPPFSFNSARMLLAALTLLPVVFLMDRKAARAPAAAAPQLGDAIPFARMNRKQWHTLMLGGLCCGVMLALGSCFQQLGFQMGASAGKAGFVTALYIVLVPILGLLWGKRVRKLLWAAVAICAVGLYLLCIHDGFRIEPCDVFLILCALSFSGHILVVDYFSRHTDCVKLSCMQFFVVAILCGVLAAFYERPTLQGLIRCVIPILYSGMLSGAMGYTLQIVAQKDSDPTVASLIMSLESFFAVLAAWLILGDQMSPREYLGCFAMMVGIIISQLRPRQKR
ncbi:MAG: DMT family transporter [Clostridia bacterium]